MTDGVITMDQKIISFGDNVRIRNTAATHVSGVAGLTGQVYGETTPSVTKVDVIGGISDDYAINVHFEERHESLWFAPDLLELVDHAAGTTITLKGIDKKWTRTESGDWQESPSGELHKSFWYRLTGRVFKGKG